MARSRSGGSASENVSPPLIGRLLVGVPLAVSAFMNLVHVRKKIASGREAGLPMARVLVPGGSIALLGGGIGIGLWRVPVAATSVASAFLAIATPVYHDFWNASGEERVEERQSFENNLVMLGATVLLLHRALRDR
jgi:putative oxidoreductase